MTDAAPLVSVAIRASRKLFVAQAIESVLSQTFHDLELVVYDSAGDLESIAASFDDRRLRYQRASRKLDDGDRTRAALMLCRGPVIGLLDDDDLYQPRFVELAMERFDRDPEVGVVFANHFWEVGGRRFPRQCPLAAGTYPRFLPTLIRSLPVPLSATLMRREVFEQGERDAPIPADATGDLFIWLRAAHAGWPFAYIDQPLMTYRVHAAQTSNMRAEQAEKKVRTWSAFAFEDPESEALRRRRLAVALLNRAASQLAEGHRGAARADLADARALGTGGSRARAALLRLLTLVPFAGPPVAWLWHKRPHRRRLGPPPLPQ